MAKQGGRQGKAKRVRLAVLDRACRVCGGPTYAQDRKRRTVSTREGRLAIESQMTLCRDESCPGHHRLVVAEEEALIAPPWWRIGWDVFAWIGHRRFSLHRSVPDIQEELGEEFGIELSDDAIEDYVAKYQAILAARQNDPERLVEDYRGIKDLVLTVDGLQPEKGHETLYTVRELNAGRIWFAVPLLSSAAEEVRVELLEKAKEWVALLGKPLRAWMSDKQDAFVTGIAAVFPDVPHRYCQSHFLRDVAKPMQEFDSHVKVQMRTKVRGLREIERKALADQKEAEPQEQTAAAIVLKYCGTVRGILNRNQGGPLDPPGLRMARALEEVRSSLDRNLAVGLDGPAKVGLRRLAGCIDRGMAMVADDLARIPGYVEDMRAIQATLDPKQASIRTRQQHFARLVDRLAADPDQIRTQMAGTMERFRPGLFAGGAKLDDLKDNMDLERWFRLPKSHARKIHGRQHAGTRIVVEGPSLALALDAHRGHRRPFTEDELRPYLGARPDPAQADATERRRLMAKARSREALPKLLSELETQYQGIRAR